MHILLYPYLGVPFSWGPGQIASFAPSPSAWAALIASITLLSLLLAMCTLARLHSRLQAHIR